MSGISRTNVPGNISPSSPLTAPSQTPRPTPAGGFPTPTRPDGLTARPGPPPSGHMAPRRGPSLRSQVPMQHGGVPLGHTSPPPVFASLHGRLEQAQGMLNRFQQFHGQLNQLAQQASLYPLQTLQLGLQAAAPQKFAQLQQLAYHGHHAHQAVQQLAAEIQSFDPGRLSQQASKFGHRVSHGLKAMAKEGLAQMGQLAAAAVVGGAFLSAEALVGGLRQNHANPWRPT